MLKKLCILFCMVFILCSCQAEETEADVSDTTVETTTAEETTALEPQGLLTRQRIREGYTLIDFPDGEFLEKFENADYATYKKTDRNLIFDHFSVLNWEMTKEDIYELFGEPSGLVNDSWPMSYYELIDGTYIVFEFSSYHRYYHLDSYYHIDANGKILFSKAKHPLLTDEEIAEGYYIIQIPGFPVSRCKDYDRTLYFEDFDCLKLGMRYSEIVEVIGEPNGEVGSGIIRPYYKLADGTYMVLDLYALEGPLYDMCYVDREGNKTWLFSIREE